MKKHWLFLLLALLFAASFSGCGSETASTPTQSVFLQQSEVYNSGINLVESGPARLDDQGVVMSGTNENYYTGLVDGVVLCLPGISAQGEVGFTVAQVSYYVPGFGAVLPFAKTQVAHGQNKYFFAVSDRRIASFSLSSGFDNSLIMATDNVVAMSCSGACLYVLEDSGLLEIFDIRTGQPIRRLSELPTYISAVSHFAADGNKLYITHFSSARSYNWLYEYDVSNPELPYRTGREVLLGNNDDQVIAIKVTQGEIVASVWRPRMGPSSGLVVIDKSDFTARGLNQVADYMHQHSDILVKDDLVFTVGTRRRGGDISATANKPCLSVYRIVSGAPTHIETIDLAFVPRSLFLNSVGQQLVIDGIAPLGEIGTPVEYRHQIFFLR